MPAGAAPGMQFSYHARSCGAEVASCLWRCNNDVWHAPVEGDIVCPIYAIPINRLRRYLQVSGQQVVGFYAFRFPWLFVGSSLAKRCRDG